MTGIAFDSSRRKFLRGGSLNKRPSVLPPWVSEVRLIDACTRCGACISACEERVLEVGDGGFPVFNPHAGSGECTFCGSCAERCEAGVFERALSRPWSWLAAIDEQRCLARMNVYCSACRESCTVDAIRMFPRVGGVPFPVLQDDACTGCGACVAPCPASAIALWQGERETQIREVAE